MSDKRRQTIGMICHPVADDFLKPTETLSVQLWIAETNSRSDTRRRIKSFASNSSRELINAIRPDFIALNVYDNYVNDDFQALSSMLLSLSREEKTFSYPVSSNEWKYYRGGILHILKQVSCGGQEKNQNVLRLALRTLRIVASLKSAQLWKPDRCFSVNQHQSLEKVVQHHYRT